MNATVYLNTTDKTITIGGGAWSPPTLTFGETIKLAVRFEKDVDGTAAEVSETVNYLKAGVGNLDARPESGTWSLKIGDDVQSAANTVAGLAWNIQPKALQSAINSLSSVVAKYGPVVVGQSSNSYYFQFGGGPVEVSLALVDSHLEPACVGLPGAYQVSGKWIEEIRLCQAPAAYTDASARVLADAPTVAEVQVGYSDAAGSVNEVQQLTMPADFRGTYQFRWKNVRTDLLSFNDDASTIAGALAVYGKTLTVTNPRDNIARIEFEGDFAGFPEPILEVIVVDSPEGDLTFSMPLDTSALAALLRNSESGTVDLPLEIEVGITDSTQRSGIRIEKFRTEVTIQRGLIFGLLAEAQNVDWLRPMPTDYIPFTMDQVFRGQLYYAAPVGDGVAVRFVIDHNLASDAIASVLIRENIADGRVLVAGIDYTITYGGANSLTVTLSSGISAPAAAGLLVVITAAGLRDSFLAHTHTIQQIVGLEELLDTVGQRLDKLEAYIPKSTVSSTTSGSPLTINILATANVLFYNPTKLDLTAMPVRAPYLLPAIILTTPSALPTPLPSASGNVDAVWQSSTRQLIPGSTGYIPPSIVEANGFVGSDGRILYPVMQSEAGKTSYYPKAFERTLFEFPINSLQLLAGRSLELNFGVATQLLNANCEAQWVLVLDHGVAVDQITPAAPGKNLETITWNATPLLTQRLFVTSNLMTHTFGCTISRSVDGITANQIRYGGTSIADSAPTTADFVLRARLIEFDTKNNVHNANGWLYYAFGDSKTITSPATATIATS